MLEDDLSVYVPLSNEACDSVDDDFFTGTDVS